MSIGPGEVRMSPISCATGPGAPVPTSPSDYYVDDTKISFYNATAGPVHVFHLWYDASAGQYRAFEAEIVHAGGRADRRRQPALLARPRRRGRLPGVLRDGSFHTRCRRRRLVTWSQWPRAR
ncbi:hypothetical protein ACFQX7_38765 [Luedemannella flava]